MADEIKTKKPRAWWKRKTEQGLAIVIVGEILGLIPVTAPLSPIVVKIGILWGGIGVVHRNIKEEAT